MTAENPTLSIDWVSPNGKTAKGTIVLRLGDREYTDELAITKAKARSTFIADVGARWPALHQPEHLQDLEEELEKIAAEEAARISESHVGRAAHEVEDPAKLLAAMPEDVRREADTMLSDPMLIDRVMNDIAAMGIAGERDLVASIYLIGTSRLLESPLALILQGPSSSGKSYLIGKTAALFPPEEVIHATQMTPQAFFHLPSGSLSHRFVVAGERSSIENDEAAEATRALREMLSAGKLTKLMPMKVAGGRIETVLIEQEGPIAYVESTTKNKIFEEDANRSIMCHTDERPDQTRRIIGKLAVGYCGQITGDVRRITACHHALQRALDRRPVVVPYASRLGALFQSERIVARRAFPQLMSMIQAVTLLHQRQRPADKDGRFVATPEDYKIARQLLVKPFSHLLGGRLSDPARRFYDRLVTWVNGPFTTTEAVRHENRTASDRAVRGWLGDLHDTSLVVQKEPSRGRKPATWELTDEEPENPRHDCPDLPTVEAVFP